MNRTLLPATEVLNRWATSSARRARLEGEEPGQPLGRKRGEDGQDPIRRLRSGSRVGFEPLKGGNLYPPPSALRQPEGVERGGGLRSGVGLPSPIFSTRPRGAGSRGRKGTPKPPRPLRPQARQREVSPPVLGAAPPPLATHEGDAPLGDLDLDLAGRRAGIVLARAAVTCIVSEAAGESVPSTPSEESVSRCVAVQYVVAYFSAKDVLIAAPIEAVVAGSPLTRSRSAPPNARSPSRPPLMMSPPSSPEISSESSPPRMVS